MARTRPDRDDVRTFDSWGEMVDHADTPGTTPWSNSRNERDEYWAGTRTWEEALKLARQGWPKGEEMVGNLARRLEVKLINRIVREDVNYDVEGMSFDVSRYLEGEPEHWTRMEESTMQKEGQRHVKIMVTVAVSCGVRAEVITARGAAITALIELLEYAGQRVELWIADAQSDEVNTHPFYQRYTRVKPYDQPLDVARVAFALANPACQRRLGFSLMEHARPDIARRLSSHYGISVDVPKDVQEDCSIYFGKMQGYTDSQWDNPATAETWVLAQLAAQGVVLRDEE